MMRQNLPNDIKFYLAINPLSVNPTKWSNALRQFVGSFADELFDCIWQFRGLET